MGWLFQLGFVLFDIKEEVRQISYVINASLDEKNTDVNAQLSRFSQNTDVNNIRGGCAVSFLEVICVKETISCLQSKSKHKFSNFQY